MIDPPGGLAGTAGSPITVAALHDGEVLISGAGAREPIRLDGNPWFNVEGVDACCSDGEVVVARSADLAFRRVVAWDAFDGNLDIFGAHYDAERVLFEDCAGFGIARKGVSATYSQGSVTSRRMYIRLNGSRSGGNIGVSAGYESNNNLLENVIVTADGDFWDERGGYGLVAYISDDRDYDLNNHVFGSIAYHLAEQEIGDTDVWALYRPLGSSRDVRELLVFIDSPQSEYGVNLRFTAQINPTNYSAEDAH